MMKVIANPDLAEAKRVKRRFREKLNRLQWAATKGDNQAALDLIRTLAEYYRTLHDTGYRTTDENEDGRVGRLVVITQEYLDEKRAKMSETDRLFEQARKAWGTPEHDRLASLAIRSLALHGASQKTLTNE